MPRCLAALRGRFANEPDKRDLFERAINSLGTGVQAAARPRLLALLELSRAQVAAPKRPKGPPTTLTVRFPVEVSLGRKPVTGAKLAGCDGATPELEDVDGIPSLDDVPGRRSSKLQLAYDAKTTQLGCLLVMELARPLAEDELETLRDEWLVEFDAGFDQVEVWTSVKREYYVSVDFGTVLDIVQTPIVEPTKKPATRTRRPRRNQRSAADPSTDGCRGSSTAPRRPS